MLPKDSTLLYEEHVGPGHVFKLHQLCERCARLQNESQLLLKMSRGEPIRLGTQDMIEFGPVADLKAGYLHDCHLCALLWKRCGGRWFDPDAPMIEGQRIKIEIKARNFDLEYQLETQSSRTEKWWSKMLPPFMYE